MQSLPRWRSVLILRNSVNFSSTQFAFVHSTPIWNEKWKKKWNSVSSLLLHSLSRFIFSSCCSCFSCILVQFAFQDFKRGQHPSKNYARYVIREKRADAKRALRSLLFNCESIGDAFENEERASGWDTNTGSNSNNSTKKGRSKSDSRRAQKIHNHRMRRKITKLGSDKADICLGKLRKGLLSEDEDDYPETLFHATFGNKWYTWSFNPWTRSSQSSTTGFKWRETFHHTNDKQEEQEETDETHCEYEIFNFGSHSDRAILGLPLKGPLKKEDVKNAFHLSALKWHPDKHQGPSQAAAEEKFKECVNAYKSLCSALTAA
ncbi:hypothetical protein Cgig2_033618 [Carnegiea gigantea]|uniref:J domain-containing protein n=1 Tax=Carnegiea gigantea TaxID=171969 RepID=A0A9Q1KP00_9CARY|nr:hypothetical protein Cgig2_033618 [Carnegiea gigantea]